MKKLDTKILGVILMVGVIALTIWANKIGCIPGWVLYLAILVEAVGIGKFFGLL